MSWLNALAQAAKGQKVKRPPMVCVGTSTVKHKHGRDRVTGEILYKDVVVRHMIPRDQNKYSGADLREIRRKQARDALDNHYAKGGATIDESRVVDPW